MLLDAYYIVDKGVAKSVEAERRKGRRLACSRGCAHCCRTQKDIPVYPLELVGISWYVTEKISGPDREVLRVQLQNHGQDIPCPFLVGRICIVHAVRPLGCRQFNVFGRPCAEGEDPFHTRQKDVLAPVKKYVDQAFMRMLPFYGVNRETERVRVVERGEMHRMARPMHSCNWKTLADRMRQFDKGI